MKQILLTISLFFVLFVSNGQVVKNWLAQSKSIDSDVQAKINALGITNVRHIYALNNLLTTFKSFNSIQTGFIDFSNPNPQNNCIGALWIGLGGTDLQKRFNVMNPVDDTTAFVLTSHSGVINQYGFYNDNSGIKYFDTHLRPYSHLTNNDMQMSFFLYQNATIASSTSATGWSYNLVCPQIGCNGATNNFRLYQNSTNSGLAWIGDGAAYAVIPNDYTNGIYEMNGLCVATRNGTSVKSFKKGVQKNSTTRSMTLTSDLDLNLFIGANNNNHVPASGLVYNKQLIRYVSVGKHIDDALQNDYNKAVEQFCYTINPIIIFVGASITEGVGASTVNNRWSTILSQTLDSYLEFNFALAGTCMQMNADSSDASHTMYHSKEYSIPNAYYSNQIMIISDMGWNDIAIRSLTDSVNFYNQYSSFLQRQIAKGYLPYNIYIENLPRAWNDYIPTTRAIWDSFQRTIERICTETGCNFVDWYGYQNTNDTGNLWNVTTGNTVHLNDLGNQKKAEFYKTLLNIRY